MGDIKDTATKSTDPAVRKMIARAETMEVSLVWDRYGAMVPQCGFAEPLPIPWWPEALIVLSQQEQPPIPATQSIWHIR